MTGTDAGGSAARNAFKDSFIYLTNQYLSGGRMLQSGYMSGGFPHIFAVLSRLARLLHCVGDSVACQISTSLLVIRDWIRKVRRGLGTWPAHPTL